jgi:transcriptional regulator with XRE-family HTH domain
MTGAELRRLRQRLNWTQAQLADALGVAANSVARWEREEMGMREPMARLIRMIAAQHAPAKPKRRA